MAWTDVCRRGVLAFLCVATLAMAGCGGSVSSLDVLASDDSISDEPEAAGYKKIGKPYKVGGRWYTPKHDEDYDKVGRASWYGSDFHGKSTANGEIFDKTALTAAHPTLPLPSYVRVTVLKTGKSAVLRVNDRGPFHKGRIIDVSKAAADKLGFRNAGSAKVRVEYLGEAPIGGGDAETLVAENKYGKTSKKSFSDYLPSFGLGGSADDDDDERKVEVRLAAATPVSREERNRRVLYGEDDEDTNLPGVRVNRSYQPSMLVAASQPSSVQAYVEEQRKESGGAIDALVTMNSASLEEEEPAIVASAAAPAVTEEAVAASQERVMGAFDMFAAAPSGGSTLQAAAPAQ